MREIKCDVAIIGAGPAGLAAAVSAKKSGAENVLVIERDTASGGILQQCIHAGFGLSYFHKEMTGPEYATTFRLQCDEEGVNFLFDTMVLEVRSASEIICSSTEGGLIRVIAGATVLAMGCRERTRQNLRIPGTRPSGIFTAGTAQRLINRQNEMVGRNVVILGSGDIGMIMARRMSLEGANVKAVVEIMPYLAGLTRNKVQCLDDFGIPLMLSHTVTKVMGEKRVEGVYVAEVDTQRKPISLSEQYIECDTLLLSVGLIPENELTKGAGIVMNGVTNGPEVDQWMQTVKPGLFACGNVVHVNDLADNVSLEAERAGRFAALYAAGKYAKPFKTINTIAGEGVRYVCPQRIVVTEENETVRLYFRVKSPGRATVLKAVCGVDTVASREVRRVSPGEMEHIDINTKDITGDVVISAEEVMSL